MPLAFRNFSSFLRLLTLATFALTAPPAFAQVPTGARFAVVLDPGHGGSDEGVRLGALIEKDLMLKTALKIEELLSTRTDLEVVLTRREDYNVTSADRRAVANRQKDGIFISLHLAYATDPRTRGALVLLLPGHVPELGPSPLLLERAHLKSAPESFKLGSSISDSLGVDLGPSSLRISPLLLIPLTGITLPGALVELDHLSSFEESPWKDDATLGKYAGALVAAIDRYRSSRNNPAP